MNQNPEKAFKDQVQLANCKKQRLKPASLRPEPDDELTANVDAPAYVAVDDDDNLK